MFQSKFMFAFSMLLAISSNSFAQTPHELLSEGTAQDVQTALEMMKEDPTWISKRDTYRQTPLHVAARNNHVVIVKWLLDNGADVDAKAYRSSTPLDLTTNPEIVKLILEKNPNLGVKGDWDTPLYWAIEELSCYTDILDPTPDDKRLTDDLRKIIDIYVEHLGDEIDLISAIKLGELKKVQKILTQNPHAAHGSEDSPHPLRVAADSGQFEICKFLVEKYKVDINDFEGGNGYPIILSALNYPKIVKYLIEHGADLKTRITWVGGRSGAWIVGDNATILHYAAQDGVPETINILLDAGIDAFAIADEGSLPEEGKLTALEVAARMGRTENAIAILEHPKFKESDDKMRQEGLDKSLIISLSTIWSDFQARGSYVFLETLISHGANCKATRGGYSAIQFAVSNIYSNEEELNQSIRKIVSVLRKHGVKLDVFSAVAIRDLDSLAQLLQKNPEACNSYSMKGYPALHMAIKMNYPKAVKLLLDAGCDIEIKNKSEYFGWKGGTPLLCVASWGHNEIAETLIEAGANVNAKSEKQVTPLHEAVRLDNLKIARLLLENGADIQAKDYEGKTPLQQASETDNAEEVEKLFSEFADLKSESASK
ncbi:ankyrin repeat domain-containing protein [uncultured Rubinisphaera sp.]|uniref:ankyrin repeat domain-containing protein n=1 Tax=uncultured Rubinisphaera sp. TaxID=1678686 RepID=UPI0026A09CD4